MFRNYSQDKFTKVYTKIYLQIFLTIIFRNYFWKFRFTFFTLDQRTLITPIKFRLKDKVVVTSSCTLLVIVAYSLISLVPY